MGGDRTASLLLLPHLQGHYQLFNFCWIPKLSLSMASGLFRSFLCPRAPPLSSSSCCYNPRSGHQSLQRPFLCARHSVTFLKSPPDSSLSITCPPVGSQHLGVSSLLLSGNSVGYNCGVLPTYKHMGFVSAVSPAGSWRHLCPRQLLTLPGTPEDLSLGSSCRPSLHNSMCPHRVPSIGHYL